MVNQVSVLTHHERVAIREVNINKILTFLGNETFSSSNVLQRLISKAPATTSRVLKSMFSNDLISKSKETLFGHRFTLWGITKKGVKQVGLGNPFNRKRISLKTIVQRIEIQTVRLILESKGYTHWRSSDHPDSLKQYKQFNINPRTEGSLVDLDNQRIAIEKKRSIQHKTRYRSIMLDAILARKHEIFFNVIYILPNINAKNSLIRIFENIKEITSNGVRHTVSNDDRNIFKFYTLGELEEMIACKNQQHKLGNSLKPIIKSN